MSGLYAEEEGYRPTDEVRLPREPHATCRATAFGH